MVPIYVPMHLGVSCFGDIPGALGQTIGAGPGPGPARFRSLRQFACPARALENQQRQETPKTFATFIGKPSI